MPVEWSSRIEIGVPEIDAQHRELFGRLAAFDEALRRGDPETLSATFAFLRDYAAVHFAAEEGVMLAARYPRLDEQRRLHAEFMGRVGALADELARAGPSAFLGLRTRNWITLWLHDHVGEEDVRLGLFLKGT